jgi:hypothetical protein
MQTTGARVPRLATSRWWHAAVVVIVVMVVVVGNVIAVAVGRLIGRHRMTLPCLDVVFTVFMVAVFSGGCNVFKSRGVFSANYCDAL